MSMTIDTTETAVEQLKTEFDEKFDSGGDAPRARMDSVGCEPRPCQTSY